MPQPPVREVDSERLLPDGELLRAGRAENRRRAAGPGDLRPDQLSSRPKAMNRKDDRHYSRYFVRRLTAEQLLDAICQVTGQPEKFAGYPIGTRATQLPDTKVGSYFLDVFGRPPRQITCDCE